MSTKNESVLALENIDEPKKTRKGRDTVRKHRVDNINRNNLAQALDTYAAEGRVIIALNISLAIGGTYEVVSYKNEVVH